MMTEIKAIHCTNEDNFFTKAWIKNHCMALSGRPFARLVEKNQECCFYFLLHGTVTKNNKKKRPNMYGLLDAMQKKYLRLTSPPRNKCKKQSSCVWWLN